MEFRTSLSSRAPLRAIAAVLLAVFCGLTGFVRAQDAGDAVALFQKAQDVHEKGDLSGAIKLYDQAIAAMPEFPEAEYQRASAFSSLGKTDEAIKGFMRAAELRADWSLPLAAAGDLYVRSGKLAEAREVLTKAIALDSQNPQALAALADLYIKTKADAAIREKLLADIAELTGKANPTAGLWFARAALEASLSKNDAAAKSVERTLAMEPSDRAALHLAASLLIGSGDTERARSFASKLEKAGASAETVAILRARILARDGDTDAALKLIDGMKSDEARELRAMLTTDSAVDPAELEKQLGSDPKNAGILSRLCVAYRRESPLKALEFCRRASEAEPNNMTHAVGFAAALVQAKDYESAVGLLRKIITITPDNWTAHANLATALFQLGRLSEAKTEYIWLSSRQPSAAAPYFFLGIVNDRLGEYLDARANYQQYLRLADPVANKLDIERVTLRLPSLEKDVKKSKK